MIFLILTELVLPCRLPCSLLSDKLRAFVAGNGPKRNLKIVPEHPRTKSKGRWEVYSRPFLVNPSLAVTLQKICATWCSKDHCWSQSIGLGEWWNDMDWQGESRSWSSSNVITTDSFVSFHVYPVDSRGTSFQSIKTHWTWQAIPFVQGGKTRDALVACHLREVEMDSVQFQHCGIHMRRLNSSSRVLFSTSMTMGERWRAVRFGRVGLRLDPKKECSIPCLVSSCWILRYVSIPRCICLFKHVVSWSTRKRLVYSLIVPWCMSRTTLDTLEMQCWRWNLGMIEKRLHSESGWTSWAGCVESASTV